MDFILRDVDSKILFGEAKKRREVYAKALNYLMNNTSILTPSFIVNALSNERFFLLLAISEVLVKRYREMLRVFLELLEKHPIYARILGLSHLTFYRMLVRGLGKHITSPQGVNVFQVEECLKYGVHEFEELSILKCREHYIDRLRKFKDDASKALSIALPLALRPSVIRLPKIPEDSRWVTLWPYTLVYSREEAKLKWFQYSSLVKEYDISRLDIDDGNINFIPLDNAVTIVFKKHSKSVAIASSVSTEPRVITGNSICYNGIDSLYSLEFSSEDMHIRKYDEYGNMVYSKVLKALATDASSINCFPTSDMGVVFNAITKQGSLIVVVNDNSINTQRFRETITAIATLPLGFNILYTDSNIYIAKTFRGSLKITGPYNKPQIGDQLFIGAVQDLGIVAITSDKIYELDALGNIISSKDIGIPRKYAYAKAIHTYLFPIITLMSSGAVSEILLYFENSFTKLDPKALGAESEVLDLTYSRGALCFNTVDYTSICVSPLYMSWLIQNKLRQVRKYTLSEMLNTYSKVKSFEDAIYVGEAETYFNSQVLEEAIHGDYVTRVALAKVIGKDISTPLNKMLGKALKMANSDNYLDVIFTEYQDNVRDSNLAIASNTVSKILSHSIASEINLDAVRAIARAIDELVSIASTGAKGYVSKVMAKLLGAFEALKIEPQNLRHVLNDIPSELRNTLLKGLVHEAMSNTAIVSSTAEEVLKILEYDIASFRNEMMGVVKVLSKLFPGDAIVTDAIQKQYEYLLSNAQFTKLTEYLSNSKKLVELVEDLNSKLREYGIDLSVNQEFRNEVAKCLNTELTAIQLSYCRDNLLSLFECNIKLRKMLESIYNEIRGSRYINRDAVDNIIRDLKSCKEMVKAVSMVREKISRLMLIEDSLNKLAKGIEELQPLGDVLRDDIEKAYEAIKKLDEAHAKELLNILRSRFRELVEVNKYLKKFLLLGDREPFNYIRSDIEDLVKQLVENIKSRSISIDDMRRIHSNIAKIIEEVSYIDKAIKSMEEALRILVSDSEELKQHKAFILRQYLSLVMSQGFETSFKELNRLQDMLSNVRIKLNSLINNINNVRKLVEALGLTKLLEYLDTIISYVKSQYKGLDARTLPLYIERLQELVNKIAVYDEKAKNLYTELNSLLSFLEGLDKDVANHVIEYLRSSFKIYVVARSDLVLDDLSAKLAAVLKSKVLIYEMNKKVKDLKEYKEALKSRFGKALVESAIESALRSLSMLRFNEVFEHLDMASKIIAKLKLHMKIYTIDDIVSALEASGMDMNKIELSKNPLESINEICKLSSIESIVVESPKLVAKALLITNKIDDSIRIAKLAYNAAKKLNATDFIIKTLDSMKPGSLSDVILQLLSRIGMDLLKVDKSNVASYIALFSIFEDYVSYANKMSCKDRERAGELYDVFCVREDTLQSIALAALWCSEENTKCFTALGILGGFHIKMLRFYINELSKILETRFKDADIAPIKYVSEIFWNSKPSKVHEELDKSLGFVEERSRIFEMLKMHRGYVRRDLAEDLLRISKDIFNMMRDEDYYRGRLQKGLELEALGELSMDASSEIVLRIINNVELPVEVKDVKIHNFTVSEKVIRIEPGGYQDLFVILPRLDIDERALEKGREVNIVVQFAARVPGIQDSRYSAIYSSVAIPVRYYGSRSRLLEYIEKLREEILDVEIPTALREAVLGVGGNNIVLLGISSADGKRVVIKVPGFVADLGAIPTLSLSILTKCKNYADKCVEATRRCMDKVARVRRIELNPPYAVEEYIDGETLRKKLNEHKQLSKSEALRIALSVGEAIKCLHSSGIFHNDIRPENVMLSRGSIVLIDACIDEIWDTLKRHLGPQIKAESLVGSRIDEAYTHPILVEKLKEGGITDDDRAKLDVFQLGLLVYEMLLGYNPISKLKSGASRLLPEGLEDLEKILMRVCSPSKLPELTIEEFLEELKKLL